jgi:hypothetical protein
VKTNQFEWPRLIFSSGFTVIVRLAHMRHSGEFVSAVTKTLALQSEFGFSASGEAKMLE